jgi:hypothetical protein
LILCVSCYAAENAEVNKTSNGKVKVFILAGQSNMEVEGDNKARYEKFTAGEGKWKERDDVWIKFFDRHGKLTVDYGCYPSAEAVQDEGFVFVE